MRGWKAPSNRTRTDAARCVLQQQDEQPRRATLRQDLRRYGNQPSIGGRHRWRACHGTRRRTGESPVHKRAQLVRRCESCLEYANEFWLWSRNRPPSVDLSGPLSGSRFPRQQPQRPVASSPDTSGADRTDSDCLRKTIDWCL